MNRRFMRLMVFFDLPTKEKKERKRYSRFRKFLLNDGYDMLQYSVYSRICRGLDNVNTHVNRLKANLPPEGSIRLMIVTDKQYGEMDILVGEKTVQEEYIDNKQLLIF